MRYYAPQYRRRQTAEEISRARTRARHPGRRDAWDQAPDRGDFDDLGRDELVSRYHAEQRRRKGTY